MPPNDHQDPIEYTKERLILRYKKFQSITTIDSSTTIPISEIELPVESSDDIKKLFSPNHSTNNGINTSSNRIFIHGKPGIGKSTSTRYFAYSWATGKLWNDKFDFVFLLPLNNLKDDGHEEQEGLAAVIYRECINIDGINDDQRLNTIKEISDILANRKDKYLIILDGNDEIAHKLLNSQRLKNLITTANNATSIITTSRINYLNENIGKTIELTGFSNLQIDLYIKYFFANNKEAGYQLIKHLEQNYIIKDDMHIPFHLELLCVVWQNNYGTNNNFMYQNILSLYQEISKNIIGRFLKDKMKMDTDLRQTDWFYQQIDPEIEFLERIAYSSMKNDDHIISTDTINNVLSTIDIPSPNNQPILKNISSLGFTQSTKQAHSGAIEPHKFIHLTIKELFAAKYCVKQLKKNDGSESNSIISFIKNSRYDPRFEVVLRFIAGILSNDFIDSNDNINKLASHRFWDTLHSKPYDITQTGHLRIILLCAEEASRNKNYPNHIESLRWVNKTFRENIHLAKENSFRGKIAEILLTQTADVLKNSIHLIDNTEINQAISELITSNNINFRNIGLNILSKIKSNARYKIINKSLNYWWKYIAETASELDQSVLETLEKIFLELKRPSRICDALSTVIEHLHSQNTRNREIAILSIGYLTQAFNEALILDNNIFNVITEALNDHEYRIKYAAFLTATKIITRFYNENLLENIIGFITYNDNYLSFSKEDRETLGKNKVMIWVTFASMIRKNIYTSAPIIIENTYLGGSFSSEIFLNTLTYSYRFTRNNLVIFNDIINLLLPKLAHSNIQSKIITMKILGTLEEPQYQHLRLDNNNRLLLKKFVSDNFLLEENNNLIAAFPNNTAFTFTVYRFPLYLWDNKEIVPELLQIKCNDASNNTIFKINFLGQTPTIENIFDISMYLPTILEMASHSKSIAIRIQSMKILNTFYRSRYDIESVSLVESMYQTLLRNCDDDEKLIRKTARNELFIISKYLINHKNTSPVEYLINDILNSSARIKKSTISTLYKLCNEASDMIKIFFDVDKKDRNKEFDALISAADSTYNSIAHQIIRIISSIYLKSKDKHLISKLIKLIKKSYNDNDPRIVISAIKATKNLPKEIIISKSGHELMTLLINVAENNPHISVRSAMIDAIPLLEQTSNNKKFSNDTTSILLSYINSTEVPLIKASIKALKRIFLKPDYVTTSLTQLMHDKQLLQNNDLSHAWLDTYRILPIEPVINNYETAPRTTSQTLVSLALTRGTVLTFTEENNMPYFKTYREEKDISIKLSDDNDASLMRNNITNAYNNILGNAPEPEPEQSFDSKYLILIFTLLFIYIFKMYLSKYFSKEQSKPIFDSHAWDQEIASIDSTNSRKKITLFITNTVQDDILLIHKFLPSNQGHASNNQILQLIGDAIVRVERFEDELAANETHKNKIVINIIIKTILEYYKRLHKQHSPSPIPATRLSNSLSLFQQLTTITNSNAIQTLFRALLSEISNNSKNYNPQCSLFISYAWPTEENKPKEYWVQSFLQELRSHLKTAGIPVDLDKESNELGYSTFEFMKRAKTSHYVVLIGTPSLFKKNDAGTHFVCYELNYIRQKTHEDRQKELYRTIPISLVGDLSEGFPIEFFGYNNIRSWQEGSYFSHLKELIAKLYHIHKDNTAYNNLWNKFAKTIEKSHPELVQDLLYKPCQLVTEAKPTTIAHSSFSNSIHSHWNKKKTRKNYNQNSTENTNRDRSLSPVTYTSRMIHSNH